MDPLEYVRILRRRWPLVALATVIALGGAWLTLPEPPEPSSSGAPQASSYTAKHVLYRDSARGGDRSVRLATVALLATTGEVPMAVAERLGEQDEPALLAAEVTIEGDDDLGTVTFSSTQQDAERAVLLVDGFAEETVRHFDAELEKRRQEEIGQLNERITRLTEDLGRLGAGLPGNEGADSPAVAIQRADFRTTLDQRTMAMAQLEQLKTQGPASVGLFTIQPGVAIPLSGGADGGFQPPASPTSRIALAALVGLALGLGLAVMVDRVDNRLHGRTAIRQAFGLPVVAEIPRLKLTERRGHAIVTCTQPGSFAAEAYRVLRLSVQLMPRWILPVPNPSASHDPAPPTAAPTLAPRTTDEPARVVLVTSATAGEGKSTSVANLAASFAEVGKAVLVLDCDFRYPQMHRYFAVDPEPGVTEFLQSGRRRPSLAALAKETPVRGVWVVPNGAPPANPGELLSPDQELISAAAELADVVLVDTGPLLAVNDPAALMPRADAVIVVARSGKTTADDAARASELLAQLKAPVLGVAMVGGPRAGRGSRYYSNPGVRTEPTPPAPQPDAHSLRKEQR